jgi:hypothetical protein
VPAPSGRDDDVAANGVDTKPPDEGSGGFLEPRFQGRADEYGEFPGHSNAHVGAAARLDAAVRRPVEGPRRPAAAARG